MAKRKRTGKYIDPTTDYGFKRIFGTEASKELLIAFRNEIFRGRKTIKDLTYGNTGRVGDTEGLRIVIFDLFCTGENGEEFVIEMQTSSHANFKNRMLYYASRLVADQAEKDEDRKWNYDISEVYVVVLMDGFFLPGEEKRNGFLHRVSLCNEDTGKVFHDGFGFVYIELANFRKGESELETDLDRWIYVMKNMSEMEALPAYLRKPIFEKLFQIAEYGKLNKEERKMYNISLKRKWDLAAAFDDAIDRGRREERQKAEAEKISIALNFKKSGFPIDIIAKNTGLDIKLVERL